MPRQVWKFEVPIGDEWHELQIPHGAYFLFAGQQDNPRHVCFWLDVITDAPKVPRRFRVYGTGHDVGVAAFYRGSVQDRSHGLVWHLFQETVG